jgi:penicillin-binding protein 1B
MEPYPALALGAFELEPVELAAAYATLASGGIRHETHGLRGVLTDSGGPVRGVPLAASERVAEEGAVYLVNRLLQGVLVDGTAASAPRHGVRGPFAGKTGTTNDRRDSWFAGYSPRRATLVWVGYDDNAESHLSGARAGLPIWARFQTNLGEGADDFVPPRGIATATIDPLSGQLATSRCPGWRTESFLEGTVPSEICSLHGGAMRAAGPGPDRILAPEETTERRRRLWRWLGRVMGRDDGEDDDGPR